MRPGPALLLIAACGNGAPSAPPPAPDPAAPAPAGAAGSGHLGWQIQSGAVGCLELGKPLPGPLLTADLEQRYVARLVADAQPFEGFRFDDPPLTAAIAGGPFIASAGERPPGRCRSPAAAAARDGAIVSAIRVHGRGPATSAGVGVGSTLAELRAAYADLASCAVPPTLGGDGCAATAPSLPGVYFLFSSCPAAESGAPITRIDLRPAEPRPAELWSESSP